MHKVLVKSFAFAGLAALAPASFGAYFGGFQLLGGWPTSSCGASGDWSNDIGPDYRLNISDNGSGTMAGSGNGTFSFSRALAASDAGFNMSYRLQPRGGAAGNTYSDGSMSIPQAGDVSPRKVFQFNLHSHLGLNDAGYGISTASQMNHYFSIAGDYKGQPIYWRMDWKVRVKTSEATNVRAYAHGFAGSNEIVNGANSGENTLSGSWTGQWAQYPYDSAGTYPPITLGTSIWDGSPGSEGDIWMQVRVAFSTAPIDRLPGGSSLIVKNGSGDVRALSYLGQTLDRSDKMAVLPTGMEVIGCGDFDQNGSADLVVRGDSDGAGPLSVRTLLWLYEGPRKIRSIRLPNVPEPFSKSLNSVDLDTDGNLELVVWSPSLQRARAFEISHEALHESATVLPSFLSATNLPYHSTYPTVLGLGDFNGDGAADLVLQDPTTKKLKYRYLHGTTPIGLSAPLSPNGGSSSFLGVGHLFGSRRGLLVDTPDGSSPRTFWDMDGTTRLIEADLFGDALYRSWTVVAVVE